MKFQSMYPKEYPVSPDKTQRLEYLKNEIQRCEADKQSALDRMHRAKADADGHERRIKDLQLEHDYHTAEVPRTQVA